MLEKFTLLRINIELRMMITDILKIMRKTI